MAATLHEINAPVEAARWLKSRVTGTLRTDSRLIGAGDGFIAWPGAATDGRKHVRAALARGAAACLIEKAGADAYGFDEPAVAVYAQLKAASGPIAAAWFGAPSTQLDVLAVTGTNGKTSTAWWLAQALSNLKHPVSIPCGLVGTLGIGRAPTTGVDAEVTPDLEFNGLTTPDPVLLQAVFRRFVDDGVLACAIEASSIGLAERRLDGTQIRVAIFTNFTQDHLDYHGTMEAYWEAKSQLFRWPGLRAAVVNVDDAKGAALAEELARSGIELWTASAAGVSSARLRAFAIGYDARGLSFEVVEGDQRYPVQTALIGQYNVANLLGVLGTLRALGVPLVDAVEACSGLSPVPGRMDCVGDAGQPLVAVDYAHTPDALEKALAALRPLAAQRAGRLWCVFGCGGDRDSTKRPLMASVAEAGADAVVVTSDNPRSESPEAIIEQVRQGLRHPGRAIIEGDRALAIASSIAQANSQDVILIAGKGHEAYQEIAGIKYPFSDKAHAQRALVLRAQVGVSS